MHAFAIFVVNLNKTSLICLFSVVTGYRHFLFDEISKKWLSTLRFNDIQIL